MTRTARILGLVIAVVGLAVSGAAPSFAVPATTSVESSVVDTSVPTAVRDWMSSKAVPFVADSSPDLAGATAVGTVRRVFQWSPALWDGHVTGTNVVPTNTWIAAVRDGGTVLGTVSASTEPGTTVVTGAFSVDPDLGRALDGIRGDGFPVDDATVGEWFAVTGSTISPLNAAATAELPKPMPLSDFAAVVAARTSGSTGLDSGTLHAFIIGGVALGMLVVLVIVGVLFVRARRRTNDDDDESDEFEE